MGRPRSHSASIPAHIDQSRIPAGVYWQATGRGRWFTLERDPDTGKTVHRRLAGADARLSDLYALMDPGPVKGTLAKVIDAFHCSLEFKGLSARTKTDYGHYAKAIKAYPTAAGGKFGALVVDRLTAPIIRRWVDKVALKTPSNAAHWLRYLKRTLRWGAEHGECKTNPTREIKNVKEKRNPRMPALPVFRALQAFARERGNLPARRKGSVAPYLWAVMEIAYTCRLRGAEVLDLTDWDLTDEGVYAARRKGSRDTLVEWSPQLREAVEHLQARRKAVWEHLRSTIPISSKDRPLVISERGVRLLRSSFDTTWQRMVLLAIEKEVIPAGQRFGLHGLKHRGVTDTAGTRDVKKQASGHKTDVMVDLYDHEVAVVKPPQGVDKTWARRT